jgi:hypothetical protein
MEKSKYFNKRIKRDADNLIKLYPYNKIYVNDISNHIIIDIYDEEPTNNQINKIINPIYKFIIKKYYPFTAPEVYYKNVTYENVYKMSSQREINHLKILTNLECLCCSSILCSNNWNITLNFIDIINEINNYKKIKRNIFIKILADKIKNKYLINDINLDCYLFGI